MATEPDTGRRPLTCRWLILVLLGFALSPPAALASFTQSFEPSTIGPGSAALLRFSISNGTGNPLTDMRFDNMLPADVTIAASPLASSTCGGVVNATGGGGSIAFTNGRLPAGQSCEVSVYVVSAIAGSHVNTSGDFTSSEGNEGSSSATLIVDTNRPGVAKMYSPTDADWGQRTQLSYTIDASLVSNSYQISLLDTLPLGLVVAEPSNLVASNCVTAPTTSLSAEPGARTISASTISVAAGQVCTIRLDVFAQSVGNFAHASSISTFAFTSTTSFAVADLDVSADVVDAIQRFQPNPVRPGASTNLIVKLVNTSRSETATNLQFTLNLDGALAGLEATGMPASGVCGPASALSGTGSVSLSGGSLAPGSSCEIAIALQVPSDAGNGLTVTIPSNLTGQLGAATINSPMGSDTLKVLARPLLTKTFSDAVIGSGQTITLSYTLQNTSATEALNNFSLTDQYGDIVNGLLQIPTNGACNGTGSFSVGGFDSFQILATGLTLAAGDSCSFDVEIPITAGVANGRYGSTTTSASGDLMGLSVTAQIVEDDFLVVAPPKITTELTDAVAIPGANLTLNVTLSNGTEGQIDADEYDAFTDLAFTLGLDFALPGLAATGLPLTNPCGTGSQISGTGNPSFTNGSLNPATSCTFSLELAVPSTATSGRYNLWTSEVSATARGVTTIGPAASSELTVGGLRVSQEFLDDPVEPGGTVNLRYTLENLSPSETASNIQLTHSLSSVLSGLSLQLPAAIGCGPGSVSTGTNSVQVSLQNGSLAAGEICDFTVALNVPANATPQNYTSHATVSAVFSGPTYSFPDEGDILKVELAGEPRDLTPANLDEPDPDVDGVSTADEEAVGDGNGDGIADALQANVASLISPITGEAVTLAVDEACGSILNFAMVSAESLGAPIVASYPAGLASFELGCATAQVTLFFSAGTLESDMRVRKFGPIAPDFGGPSRWYEIPGANLDVINQTIRFTLNDGALGDSTAVDGRIVDPVGPAALPVAVPTGSPRPLIALAVVLGLLGSWQVWLRRKTQANTAASRNQ
ncbi:MAG: hypothetical protein KDH88_08705 [Chromatiales bacterium]|nr:hypothetical protein [Chromatiales bacterium]